MVHLGLAPPMILFFFGTPTSVTISRASLIAFFIGTDIIGLSFLAREELVTQRLLLSILFTSALLKRQWLGARSFKSSDPAIHMWVLCLVALLPLLTGVQGLLSLTG